MEEFERIVQRTEKNKLLTYYNEHEHVLARGQPQAKTALPGQSLDRTNSIVHDERMTRKELEKPTMQPASAERRAPYSYRQEQKISLMDDLMAEGKMTGNSLTKSHGEFVPLSQRIDDKGVYGAAEVRPRS